ncbi:RING/U-box superfamily protein [Abeliophyllum distichum]|uniref:RING/U-box superfamily protein n=1 Tax=Abeliophyllum distichum TaxID=126358 RepID=A0ABD1RSK9_9LAMI
MRSFSGFDGEIEGENALFVDQDKEMKRGSGNGNSDNEIEAVGEEGKGNDVVGEYNGERPPVDDVCPICIDNFTIPCRTNCGHWFCANCILQFWMYLSVIQPCKCPLCCLPITNLVTDMSQLVQPGEDVEEVIRKVEHYNRMFVGGLHALFLKALALPFFIKKAFRFPDLEALICILCVMRFLGLLLTLFYGMEGFDFISIGELRIRKFFDVGTSIMLSGIFFYYIWQRWELRGVERHLADLQQWNALVDLQEQEALANIQARNA